MRHVSSIQGVCTLGAVALLSLANVGCLKDIPLDGAGLGSVTGVMGTGGSAIGTGTGPGMSSSGWVGGVGGASIGGSVAVASSAVGVGVGGSGVSSSGNVTTSVSGSGVSSSGWVGGTGGFSSSSSAVSVGVGGFSAVSSSAVTTTGTGVSSSGGPAPACGLGATPVPCDFAHLNADCAPYGAVCDYVFSVCSCCFIHDQEACTQDADCESSFGANAYCSGGTCGCK